MASPTPWEPRPWPSTTPRPRPAAGTEQCWSSPPPTSGEHNDRITAVWLGGVEIQRTSTVKPVGHVDVFWKVRKDVTHFASLLVPQMSEVGDRSTAPTPSRVLSVMQENLVDDYFKGVYHVNVTLDFYVRGLNDQARKIPGLLCLPTSIVSDYPKPQQLETTVSSGVVAAAAGHFTRVKPRYGNEDEQEEGLNSASVLIRQQPPPPYVSEQQKVSNLIGRPADLVIPIANKKRGGQNGFWFRVENPTDVFGRGHGHL